MIDRAYDKWISMFAGLDPAILKQALSYPKPSKIAMCEHIDALQRLAKEGLARPHLYLRFVGD
jgi:hypothetical protein